MMAATASARLRQLEHPQLQEHQVWYEDSTSASARLDLVGTYRIGGVATWKLGLEDPNVWPTFDQWREASQRHRPAV